MSAVTSAQIVAFYLFDIAEKVELEAIAGLVGGRAVPARLAPKPVTPAYVQYEKPPLSFDGSIFGVETVNAFRTRFRVYDYGVISVAFTRDFSGTWSDLLSFSQTLIENVELEQLAERVCRQVADALRPALKGYRKEFLSEDYLVFAVHGLDTHASADELVAQHGDDIAALLRGEREPLSEQEKTSILRHRLSYLADDLVVPSWNAALVYDTVVGSQATLEILEFANSQLLEFRYYDRLLDDELGKIYGRLHHPRWHERWVAGRYAKAATQVHALLIDINELADRAENSLKFVGDPFAARLFALVADRLALGIWKGEVKEKLTTLGDIYRFAVEQSSISRGQFLELTIVLILVFELVLIFLGVMQ